MYAAAREGEARAFRPRVRRAVARPTSVWLTGHGSSAGNGAGRRVSAPDASQLPAAATTASSPSALPAVMPVEWYNDQRHGASGYVTVFAIVAAGASGMPSRRFEPAGTAASFAGHRCFHRCR